MFAENIEDLVTFAFENAKHHGEHRLKIQLERNANEGYCVLQNIFEYILIHERNVLQNTLIDGSMLDRNSLTDHLGRKKRYKMIGNSFLRRPS